jgi:hypothetical protein
VPSALPAALVIKNFESLRSSQLAGLDLAARLLLEIEQETVRSYRGQLALSRGPNDDLADLIFQSRRTRRSR